MENPALPEEIRQILTEMQDVNVKQLQVMKKQLNFFRLTSLITALALVCMLVFTGSIYMRLSKTLKDVENVTSQLAESDWLEMIDNINTLVNTSQQSLTTATEKIQSIDIEALNQAIRDLNNIIAPLAQFFGG